MTALAQGYHPDLVALDEQMLRCGRPPPPVVAWLAAGVSHLHGKEAWDVACLKWRESLERWERANPEAAREWAECNSAYARREDELLALKFGEASELYTSGHLMRLGAPTQCIDAVRKPLDKPALQAARQFWGTSAWCLTLLGGPGTGKTTAATWLALQYTSRRPRQRVQWVRAVAESAKPLYGAEAEVRKRECRTCDVLVVDDALVSAAKKPDGTYPDNPAWRQWLEDVLDARWGNGLKTVVTSNAVLIEFRARMGARLMDRLDVGHIFGVGTESMR